MNIEEFAAISRDLKIGDTPGQEFWKDIELVYMNTDLTKDDVAVLHWMGTGYFEKMVDSIKILMKHAEAYAKGVGRPRDLSFAVGEHLAVEADVKQFLKGYWIGKKAASNNKEVR